LFILPIPRPERLLWFSRFGPGARDNARKLEKAIAKANGLSVAADSGKPVTSKFFGKIFGFFFQLSIV
jgi:hypothetical protein